MEDVRNSQGVPAMLALAVVVRQFEGSRVERQVLAQAFDLAWQVDREAVGRPSPTAADGEGELVAECLTHGGAPRTASPRHVKELAGAGSEKGGAS